MYQIRQKNYIVKYLNCYSCNVELYYKFLVQKTYNFTKSQINGFLEPLGYILRGR